jgi:diketogulonate reductase-like aldo/keto reductase
MAGDCGRLISMDHRRKTENAWTRRDWLRLAAAGAVAPLIPPAYSARQPIHMRTIPRSGEKIPAIGLGTWQTFDVGESEAQRAPRREVLKEFVRFGGSVIDSSPMYGESETVAGDLANELDVRAKLFLATKVWTSGREAGIRQMNDSFRKLRSERIDLMQVHNLVDWRTHLKTLRAWKEQGRVRYIGITHYTESAYDELARVMQSEEIDFVQFNYSIVSRTAEKRLLPLARDRRIAVLVNKPFEKAGLFDKVRGKELPPWAAEFDCASWAQFFLKFILSHPAATCAIPATSKVKHLVDNMGAGVGRLPDAAMREKMAGWLAAL